MRKEGEGPLSCSTAMRKEGEGPLSCSAAAMRKEGEGPLSCSTAMRKEEQWAKIAQIGIMLQHLTSLQELIPGQSKSGGMLHREAQLF